MWSRAHSFRHEMPLSAVLSISKTLKFQSFMARSQANKMICDTTRARAGTTAWRAEDDNLDVFQQIKCRLPICEYVVRKVQPLFIATFVVQGPPRFTSFIFAYLTENYDEGQLSVNTDRVPKHPMQ